MSSNKFSCSHCGKDVKTKTFSLIRTQLCDDCYMTHGIVVPPEWWKGNTEGLEEYGNETDLCIICNRMTTKRCKLCHKYNCRPTEWMGNCMEIHLKKDHHITFEHDV